MKREYPYLNDFSFQNTYKENRQILKQIDNFVNQKQYVRIYLLDWQENILKEIQGEIVSGSLTKDGNSAVRRTCSMTTTINSGAYDISKMQMDFAINKKIFLEIGIKNYTKEDNSLYPPSQYPIFWFPQGMFFISGISIASAANAAVTIQIQLKDKMARLTGEMGGTYPATTILDTEDTQKLNGSYYSKKVKVYDIIQETVHHIGGELLDNILIEDVPLYIRKVTKWNGVDALYCFDTSTTPAETSGSIASSYFYTTDLSAMSGTDQVFASITKYEPGTDIGYIYTDFVYLSELVATAGESVTSVLDKIVSYLGNYEYFYDEYGVFHFREIKNYLNTTLSSDVIAKITDTSGEVDDTSIENYVSFSDLNKYQYSFESNDNIISITQNPSYENIKNDFVVWGEKKGANDNSATSILYHLVIDHIPSQETFVPFPNLILFRNPTTQMIEAKFFQDISIYDINKLPIPGDFNYIYIVNAEGSSESRYKFNVAYWDGTMYKIHELIAVYTNFELTPGYDFYSANSKVPLENEKYYKAKDWRTYLYMLGKQAEAQGNASPNIGLVDNDEVTLIDVEYYYPELESFWPRVYNLYDQKFFPQGNYKLGLTTKEELDAEDFISKAKNILSKMLSKDDGSKIVDGQASLKLLVNQDNIIKNEKSNGDSQLANISKLLRNVAEYSNLSTAWVALGTEEKTKWRTSFLGLLEVYKGTKGYSITIGKKYITLLANSFEIAVPITVTDYGFKNEDGDSIIVSDIQDTVETLPSGVYWLDFIDAGSATELSDYSVTSIGRRAQVVTDENINCLFFPEINDVYFLDVAPDDPDFAQSQKEAYEYCVSYVDSHAAADHFVQVSHDIYNNFIIGGTSNSAQDRVRSELWTHTFYQKSVALSTLPVYYLEPNTRIKIADDVTNTYGEYLLNNISFTLGPQGSMNCSCNECITQI